MSEWNDGFNAGIEAAAQYVNAQRFEIETDLRSIAAGVRLLKRPEPSDPSSKLRESAAPALTGQDGTSSGATPESASRQRSDSHPSSKPEGK